MNILHVLRTMHPSWGGPVEGVKNLASQATLRGNKVQVTCLDAEGSPWLKDSALPIHAVGPAMLNNFGYTRRLDEWLDANISKFDIVVVNGIWMYFSGAVRRAARRAGVPYVVFPHGALDPWFKRTYPLKQIKKGAYWALIEHKVFRDAAAVMFTSTEELSSSQGAFWPYECTSKLAGYGIEDPLAPFSEMQTQPDDRQELMHALPGLRGRPYLLYLARLHPKKGVDLLLKAIATTRHKYRDYAFVLAGPGSEPYVSKIKSLGSRLELDEQLIWAGPLYGKGKWSVMRGAEAYVLPSHQENFGISVVESLACNVPVLITNKVNIWSEIRNAGSGLVENDDLTGICSLLDRWSTMDLAEKRLMRDKARHCFLSTFNIGKTSEIFFNLLAEIAS
jgi:glycosyltransferase involved in cell wall biosynthesis